MAQTQCRWNSYTTTGNPAQDHRRQLWVLVTPRQPGPHADSEQFLKGANPKLCQVWLPRLLEAIKAEAVLLPVYALKETVLQPLIAFCVDKTFKDRLLDSVAGALAHPGHLA